MHLPPVDVRYGVLCTGFSLASFGLLNHAVKQLKPPEPVARRGGQHIWKWQNMVVSLAHALIIGTWDLLCFHFYPELMNDLVDHIVPFTYYMVAVSSGYFLFDFWEMYTHGMVFKLWELTLHHCAVLSAFLYNVLTVRYIAYNVVALLAEVNSIFLHSRKLMHFHKVSSDSPLYRLIAMINLVTFALCRGFALWRISYGMYSEPERMSSFYFLLLLCSMFIMNMINPILFFVLLRNDFWVLHPVAPIPVLSDQACKTLTKSIKTRHKSTRKDELPAPLFVPTAASPSPVVFTELEFT